MMCYSAILKSVCMERLRSQQGVSNKLYHSLIIINNHQSVKLKDFKIKLTIQAFGPLFRVRNKPPPPYPASIRSPQQIKPHKG